MNVFLRARLGMRRPERPLPALLACLAVAALTACTAGNEADAPAEPDSTVSGDAGTSRDAMHAAPDSADTRSADSMQVEVWFDRGEEVVAVMRRVPASGDTLTAALQALLAGPTEAERQQGLTSWFSAETADALRSARVEDGLAIVDLRDVSSIIPNAWRTLRASMSRSCTCRRSSRSTRTTSPSSSTRAGRPADRRACGASVRRARCRCRTVPRARCGRPGHRPPR